MKTNNRCAAVRLEKSKLVAALAILAVAFVVIAAVPAVDATNEPSQETSVDPLKGMITNAELKDGTYNLSNDAVITLTKNVTLNDVKFTGAHKLTITSNNKCKLNVNYDFKTTPASDSTAVIFKVSNVVIDNADVTIVQKDTGATDSPVAPNSGRTVFGSADVEVKNNSTLKITTSEKSNRMFYNNSSLLKIDGQGAKVVLDKATSSTVSLSMTEGAALEIKDPLFSAGNFYPNVNNTGAACSITVSGASEGNHGLFFYGTVSNAKNADSGLLKNCSVKSDGIVGFYSHKSVDATDSTIEADKLVVAKSSASEMADITGATFKVASVQAIDPNNGYKAISDKTLCLKKASFTGETIIASGMKVKIADTHGVEIKSGILKGDLEFTVKDAKLKVANGGAYDGTISFTEKVDGKDVLSSAKIALKASGAGVTISAGSITVTGNVVSGDGTASDIAAAISGISGNVVLKEVTVTSGNLTLGGTVTIKDTTLTVDDKAIVTIKGTVKQDTNITGEAIKGDGSVSVLSGATITGVNLSNTLAVDIDESVMSNTEVSGDFTTTGSQTIYTINQIITVAPGKTWTLVPGADVIIQGKLVVPEGSKIVISEGAKLTLDAKNAIASIEGDIEVNDKAGSYDAGEFIVKMGTVEFGASATIDGILAVGSSDGATPTPALTIGTVKIAQDAVLTIGESGTLRMIKGAIEVEKSGTFVLNGKIENDKLVIANSGTVKIDSSDAATKGITINQMVDGAVVDVVKFTVAADSTIDNAKIVISDEKLQFASYKDGKETKYVTNAGEKNVLTLSASVTGSSDAASVSIKNVKVVSNATSVSKDKADSPTTGIYNKKVWTKTMDIAGTLGTGYTLTDAGTTAPTTIKAKAELTGTYNEDSKLTRAYTIVSGSFTLAENAEFATVSSAYVKVTGTLDAVTDKSKLTNDGKIAVDKAGEVLNRNAAVSNITGTEYVVSMKDSTGSTVKVFHYVTLDAALKLVGADIKEIKVCGTQAVTEDATLPAEVTLTVAADGDITIGKKAGDTAKLTIAKGAKVKGAVDITVYGTLYAEDKSNIASTSGIVSDVYSEEIGADGKAPKNGWAEWTNLASAVSSGANKTITVSKTDGYVEIANNLTIPAGTTVIVPSDAMGILIKNGVTLTVAGILRTEVDVFAEAAFDTVAKNIESTTNVFSSTIIVTGELQSAVEFNYADGKTAAAKAAVGLSVGAPVAGAYYTIDVANNSYYAISSVEKAMANIADINGIITINGAITAGDITYNGTEDSEVLVIGTKTVKGDGKDIETALTVNTLTLVDSTFGAAGNGTFTGTVQIGENAITAASAKGIVFKLSDDGKAVLSGITVADVKGATLAISAGTVYLDASYAYNYDASKAKAFSVSAGATATTDASTGIIKAMIVEGTLSVPSTKEVTVTNLTVKGTVNVAAATEIASAGTLNVDNLYVGMSKSDYYKKTSAGGASVSGPVDIKAIAAISADSTIDTDLSGYKSTEFYNGSALWFTAYANGTQKITVNKAPVENADLAGWSKTADGAVDYKINDEIIIGSPTKLYSVVKTEIYKVVIKADEGVANIYLNCNGAQIQMGKGMVEVNNDDDSVSYINAFVATVSAGTYTVTWTAANGWDGSNGKLAGAGVSGTSFTCSGTSDADRAKDLQLTGFVKTGYVDPTPAPSTDDKDDGLTITDYLLIVLVVLIVILAVIVAMRLMRS